jgi:hypothetical protein
MHHGLATSTRLSSTTLFHLHLCGMGRFDGKLQTVIACIAGCAVVPDWLGYHLKGSGKMDKAELQKHSEMWQALYKVHPTLSWTKKQAEDIMGGVADRNGSGEHKIWKRKLTEPEEKDFKIKMASRFRAMCRDLSASLSKERTWAKELVAGGGEDKNCEEFEGENGEEEVPKEQDEEVEPEDVVQETVDVRAEEKVEKLVKAAMKKPAASPEEKVEKSAAAARKKPTASPLELQTVPNTFVGFDEEHLKPWRTRKGSKKTEFGELVVEDEQVLAKFADGETVELKCLSVEEAKAILVAAVHRRGSLWEKLHSVSGHALRIARRIRRETCHTVVSLMSYGRSHGFWHEVLHIAGDIQ